MNNFEKKIVEKIYKYYKDRHIDHDTSDEFGFVLTNYLNTLTKRIRARRRKVCLSKELISKMNDGRISNEHKENIEKFVKDFENGLDMNGHLSKQIYNSKFYDKLLNCWGVHHLHLSSKKAGSKNEMTANRSDTLLFCMIKDSEVYFIDIAPHNMEYVFSMFNLLNIIADNWLFLLKNYEIRDIVHGSLEPKISSDEELNMLWKANINTFYEIRGRVYGFADKGLSGIGSNIGNALLVSKTIYRIVDILPKPPIMPTDIDFELSEGMKPIGVLRWKEGTSIKKAEI